MRLWSFCSFPVIEDGGRVVGSSISIEHLGPMFLPSGWEAALECRFLNRVFDLHVNKSVGKLVSDSSPSLRSRVFEEARPFLYLFPIK